ncbi:hypothetical protein RFI_15003, partial [Reticulomyxa filosa]
FFFFFIIILETNNNNNNNNSIVVTHNFESGTRVTNKIKNLLDSPLFKGIELHPSRYVTTNLIDSGDCHEYLSSIVTQSRPPVHALFVVTRGRDEQAYTCMQTWSRRNGQKRIPVQCIKEDNAKHNQRLRSALYCLLTKANWIPWKIDWKQVERPLQLKRKKTMLVGMDINVNTTEGSAMVGFASTYDPDFVRVHRLVGIEPMQNDVIPSCDKYLALALDTFHKHNDAYPDQVIFYRCLFFHSFIYLFIRLPIKLNFVMTANFFFFKKKAGIRPSALIETIKKEEVSNVKKMLSSKCDEQNCGLEFVIVQSSAESQFYGENGAPLTSGTLFSQTFLKNQFFIIPFRIRQGGQPTPTEFIIIEDGLDIIKQCLRHFQTFSYHLFDLYFNDPTYVPHVVKIANKLALKYSQSGLREFVVSCDEPICVNDFKISSDLKNVFVLSFFFFNYQT